LCQKAASSFLDIVPLLALKRWNLQSRGVSVLIEANTSNAS
jgi:hypothetical protein